MGQENSNFISQVIPFTFDSNPVFIRIDTSSDNIYEEPKQIIKICPINNVNLRFAYEQGNGLILVGNKNNKHSSINILGEFLNINSKDYTSILKFFNEYGFLFKTNNDAFQNIKPIILTKIHNRLNALLELINLINDFDNVNLKKILELSIYMLFEDEWELKLNTGETISSSKYNIATIINSAFDFQETNRNQEVVNKGSFTIKDELYGNIEFDDKTYRDIINGYSSEDGYDDFRFIDLTYLYSNYNFNNTQEREFIHLLFNFFFRVGIPKKVSFDEFIYYKRFNNQAFDEHIYYDYAIDLAKYIIKTEFENHLKNIKPSYDEEKMMPQWKVGSLLDALYFSIFYLDSKKEMYKKCGHCGRYFIVNRSSTNKMYCDKYCRNNAQQARHRIKIKNK